jgi:sortase B
MGWLTMDDLDEPVAFKDNDFFLNHDVKGNRNGNGALFMDEDTRLITRPYTILIYGHNMKTGAMFGSLRNYENLRFYQNNAFITFDTLYEEGRYVIFSVCELSTNARDRNYFSFGRLNSDHIAWRREAISALKSHSIYFTEIDVKPEDQILLLITCVDDEEERRVVAARRVRDGEKEESLQRLVNTARKW